MKDIITYSKDQKAKIGNTLVYLARNVRNPYKTKILKLLYILDEISIKNSGIPFLNLDYKVWKFGPIEENIYVDLTSEPSLFKDYIERNVNEEGHTYISAIVDFMDDEFTDNDIELLDKVIEQFGNRTAKQLVDYTHRENAPWHNAAKKGLLKLFNSDLLNKTNEDVDLSQLIQHDARKMSIYSDYRNA